MTAESLNFAAPADGSWVTTNLAEALPGVATPMGWSIWARAGDRAARAPFAAMGAIPPSSLAYPARSEDRVVNLFYGRIAIRVDYFCEVGDLVPGASGETIARDAFGYVPPDFVSSPSPRRYPAFMVKMPITFARTPDRIRRILAISEANYPGQIARVPQLDLAAARALLREAERIYVASMSVQAETIACVIQPVYTALSGLAEQAGVDAAALMRGQGAHVESDTLNLLWKVSRDEVSLDAFLAQYGFHGPEEGELSSRSWREDPAPLVRTLDRYRALGDDEGPVAAAAAGVAQREHAEAELLAGLPASKRRGAKLVIGLGRTRLPLRSVGKVAYGRTLDIARASARRIGSLLATDGVLEDPEDIFYLTVPEALGDVPVDAAEAVAARRAQRAEYQQLELPTQWTGLPQARPIAAVAAQDRLEAIGASPGVVEGRVVVVDDPAEADLEDGEILVARTTDPSWASIMFLASALVVDIGGMLSHAAVVARELGVPCVMGTEVGTRVLRTGDVCRVDGHAGTVEIIARA